MVFYLFLDGLNALDSLDLNLIHNFKPNHMEAVTIFQLFSVVALRSGESKPRRNVMAAVLLVLSCSAS
jgi:hypothetical protein